MKATTKCGPALVYPKAGLGGRTNAPQCDAMAPYWDELRQMSKDGKQLILHLCMEHARELGREW